MKTIVTGILLTFLISHAHANCNRPVDPKKVVLMVSFHDGAEEERGARQAACERGETLVVLPKPNPQGKQIKAQMDALSQRAMALFRQIESCTTEECRSQPNQQILQLSEEYNRLENQMQAVAPDFNIVMTQFLAQAKNEGKKVSSLILSGHDGGGAYYGDLGQTDIGQISQLKQEYPEVFSDTSSLLLMGCWTGTPDQVEQWNTIFPNLRLIGGFVGSAPASTRAAAGTYVSGLLRGERRIDNNATQASVEAMLKTVQHINMVTASVYVNPACEEENSGRSPAYYYISPANDPSEIPYGMKVGMNTLQAPDAQRMACLKAFGTGSMPGTFDWNAVLQYYQGEREPENNAELRSLYSFLRNNNGCFEEGNILAPIDPDQVLMLRFFQDTKKNIGKYFKEDLQKMYETLAKLVDESDNLQMKEYFKDKKLMGEELEKMTRARTLREISHLQRIFDTIYSRRSFETLDDAHVFKTMQSIDKYLYRLKCLPPTWHDYSDDEVLAPPTC